MGLVEGPMPQVIFCGASVTSFGSSVGWNEQSSTVTVSLVEDPLLRQRFTKPQVGTPQKFAYEGFQFEGLIQRWLEKNAVDGKPTFEVTLTDPREILAGTQVILSSYRGDVGGFANLLNVFGYWEFTMGFGGSLTNESGMVWNTPFDNLGISSGGGISITPAGQVGIMPAIHIMTRHANQFGGPLRFMGHSYVVDLSGLPLPPPYYRMGGVSASLLDMVSELCQDGGNDYICILTGNVISFKTVSRARQPDPGQIANFINSQTNVTNNSIGMELRNDITNAILLGGDYSELILESNPSNDNTIWPYWGTDINGTVIMGTGQPDGNHQFHLNAAPISDIMGSTQYKCDIPEMRCALIDYDSWAYYVMKWDNDKARTINLVSAIDDKSNLNELFPETIFTRDIIDDSQHAMTLYGPMNETDYWTQRAQRVYEFVRQYATDFFGRKFLVKIPFFIYYKVEPETTLVVKSDEPTDAGYLPEGSQPLGLNYLNESFFLSADGRFQCFVKYSNANMADIQKLPPDSFVIQGTDIYMKASVDMDIGVVYPAGTIYPYCVITVDGIVYQQAKDPLGDIRDVASILDYSNSDILLEFAAGLRHDSFPIKVHPSPYRPTAVALPVKSNRDSYGPWFSSGGVDGKVSFQRDDGLVPWNYGDYNTMQLAAQAKLANAATRMQYTETGTVEMAGTPDHSLGDQLVAGGPELTGIDVSIGAGGVTTSYRMQTFTPRFGQFTKDNADRLRRLGTTAMEMRRAVRNLYQRNLGINQIIDAARSGFMANTSRAVRQQTPHQCLMATMSYDSNYGYRTQASTMTAPEVVANCRGDKPDLWPLTALMTLEGLLRPFSTNRTRDADDPFNVMPHYEEVKFADTPITRNELDPFGDFNDIDYQAWGDEYPGRVHTLKDASFGNPTNSRLIGMRGPMVMVGWGYTYTGKPVPNVKDDGRGTVGEQDWNDTFIDQHRAHMEEWKAGPIGLYWDNWRKMWTIPTVLFGTLDTAYTDGGVLMTIVFDMGYGNLTPTTPRVTPPDGSNYNPNPDPNAVPDTRDLLFGAIENLVDDPATDSPIPDPVPSMNNPTDKVRVYSWLGGNLSAGTKVCAAYYQQINRWIIISAACGSS